MANLYLLEYSEGVREPVVVSHRGGHMVPKVKACDHDRLIAQPQLCIDCAQSANVPLRTSEKVREGLGGTEFRYHGLCNSGEIPL
jgi:hypothetical protein